LAHGARAVKPAAREKTRRFRTADFPNGTLT